MAKLRILIADASATFRALLRREFDPDRYDLIEARDGEEAARIALEVKPAIVTLSMMLPKRDGIDVCRGITSHEATVGTTVVMITASDSEEDRRHAFEAGAVRFLEKGFAPGELGSYVDHITASRDELCGMRIAVVDDNAFIRCTITKLLEAEGATVIEADDGSTGLSILESHEVDMILTDYHMPIMDGITFVRIVREKRDHASTPILFLSGTSDSKSPVRALVAGANDFVRKPFEGTELLARLRSFARLTRLTQELKAMATTDELTGLANRREGLAKLDELSALAKRYNERFSCFMLDIDHFKRCNDTFGHAAGDHVLKETARVLQSGVRATDGVFRLGGEEFLILCPHTAIDAAVVCAEHVRQGIEQHAYTHNGLEIKVTASLGVAEYEPRMGNSDVVLKTADDALYAAKRAGRNRVVQSQQHAASMA